MPWGQITLGIVQLIFLLLSNSFTKNKEEKEQNDKRNKEISEDLFSGDKSRITAGLDRLRSK